jgi:hypothetical protein
MQTAREKISLGAPSADHMQASTSQIAHNVPAAPAQRGCRPQKLGLRLRLLHYQQPTVSTSRVDHPRYVDRAALTRSLSFTIAWESTWKRRRCWTRQAFAKRNMIAPVFSGVHEMAKAVVRQQMTDLCSATIGMQTRNRGPA